MSSATRFAVALCLVFSIPARALAQSAEAPLVPSTPPTSTSGTDVTPGPTSSTGSDVQGPSTPVTESVGNQEDRIKALEKRLERDEQHIRTLEQRSRPWRHLRFEGYIQPQLLVQTYNAAASPNALPNGTLPPGIGANDTIAKADGTTTNGTVFRVRRARLRTYYETDVARLFLQIDAFPAGGIGPGVGTILRNAEATGIARWSRVARTEFSAGLFFTPFRAELLEMSMERPWIERTWFIQSVFPKERDYGVHAKTIAFDDKLIVDLAIVNGQTLGERNFVALPDLNRSKDYIASLTYRLGFLTLGTAGYIGRGQNVDAALLRFKQFDKWAVNFQVLAAHRVLRELGETRLSSELSFAQNMDQGVLYPYAIPAIPTDFRRDIGDLGERALYVRFEQDVTRHATFGYRYDMYTPNTEIKNNARDTHAFLAVWKISRNLRFMNELDWSIDNVHPLGDAPRSKHILAYSGVLQAMF